MNIIGYGQAEVTGSATEATEWLVQLSGWDKHLNGAHGSENARESEA